jgi:predicted MPP superfamily phosphohydrolase
MLKLSRRNFLTTSAVAISATVAAGTVYLTGRDESEEPVVERVEIPLANLPPALAGFTIAVLADFHLYPFTRLELIDRAVAMANALNPDLTVLLGDFVWHEVEAIFDLAPTLANLNAKHGVYSILGNHDLWTEVEVVKTGLAEARLPLLVNEGLSLTVGNGTMYLAGLDDGWSGRPDLPAALAAAPAAAPVVLLAHEPDLADDFSLDGRVGLQLSGHSHGGQVRLGNRALIKPYLSWKYDQGLYNVNGMWLYTNRGVGVTNVPLRVNCAPEITEITLVAA